jgi:putative salt-induced outer membrane protein
MSFVCRRVAAKRRHAVLVALAALLGSTSALAQATPMGVPPPEGKALVEGPKKAAEEPTREKKLDGTNVTISAGGMLTTGNSRLLALSGNGVYEWRFGANSIGASALGNYGEGAPAGSNVQVTAENFQGRVRYDRYVLERASIFLINTGRHDRFQGIEFRYNLDPGFKYLLVKNDETSLWGEAGYDFQYDVRRNEDRVVLGPDNLPLLDANNQPLLVDKTRADHSGRLFAGYKHAFNKEVTFATGLEYLQSFLEGRRYRVNFDALIAANLGAGFALGFGFAARYDHAPLAGKEKLDTSSTLSLIFGFDNTAPPPKSSCPCPEPTPTP